MSFFQVDDDFWSHRKVRTLVDEQGAAKVAPAFMLWVLAGSLQRKSTSTGDGVVTKGDAKRHMDSAALAARAAALLVSADLWHAPGHECEKCPPVAEGTWLFHDWFQFGYALGAAEREAAARRKELRTPAIVEAVWARDKRPDGTWTCRYGGEPVVRPQTGTQGGLRRGDSVGQLDHVDPTRAIGATNIVVSCPDCNKRKAARTPEQAGMALLPPPERPGDQHENQNEINTRSKPEVSSPRARPRAGAGGVGTGVGVGEKNGVRPPHLIDHRPQGQAGPAPIVDTPAQFGSPWLGHHGPPPPEDLIEQATCPDHNLPRPCRKCAATPAPEMVWPASPADPPPASPPPSRPRRRGTRGGRTRKPKGDS